MPPVFVQRFGCSTPKKKTYKKRKKVHHPRVWMVCNQCGTSYPFNMSRVGCPFCHSKDVVAK